LKVENCSRIKSAKASKKKKEKPPLIKEKLLNPQSTILNPLSSILLSKITLLRLLRCYGQVLAKKDFVTFFFFNFQLSIYFRTFAAHLVIPEAFCPQKEGERSRVERESGARPEQCPLL